MAFTTSGISILDTTSNLFSGRLAYSGSPGEPTFHPSTEAERKRSGVTRRTGWGDADLSGGSGLGGSGGAIATGGAGAGAPASVLRLLRAARTRVVISSTIGPIDASSATVTAARTCSA